MYSLDINFLNDRSEQPIEVSQPKSTPPGSPVALLPIIIGGVLLVALPGSLYGLKIFYLDNQSTRLEEDKGRLTTQLQDLQAKLQQADVLEGQVNQVEADIEALINVFGKVQPVSAIIQEISNRMPSGLQADSFQVTTSSINFSGTAISYATLNDFLLVLKQSPFINPDAIQLNSSAIRDTSSAFRITTPDVDAEGNPIDTSLLPTITIDLPYVVSYSISAELSNPSALDPEVLEELRALGAIGIVTRLDVLKQEGIIQEQATEDQQAETPE